MNFKSVRIEFVNRRFVALGSFSEIAFAPTRFRTNSGAKAAPVAALSADKSRPEFSSGRRAKAPSQLGKRFRRCRPSTSLHRL